MTVSAAEALEMHNAETTCDPVVTDVGAHAQGFEPVFLGEMICDSYEPEPLWRRLRAATNNAPLAFAASGHSPESAVARSDANAGGGDTEPGAAACRGGGRVPHEGDVTSDAEIPAIDLTAGDVERTSGLMMTPSMWPRTTNQKGD